MDTTIVVDWPKVLIATIGIVGGWLAPRLYRAVKNLGKTEQNLADEDLEAALKRAETAHANADPTDDAAADAAVVAAKRMKAKAARLAALANAFADPSEDPNEKP